MYKIFKNSCKNILLLLFVLFPIFVVFYVGLPIKPTYTSSYTERCYKLSDIVSYLSCINSPAKRLFGFNYFEKIVSSINSLFFPFGFLFITAFILSIVAVVYINLFLDKER